MKDNKLFYKIFFVSLVYFIATLFLYVLFSFILAEKDPFLWMGEEINGKGIRTVFTVLNVGILVIIIGIAAENEI